MSLRSSSWAWSQRMGESKNDRGTFQCAGLKLLLVKLADYEQAGGECWPAIGTLVELTELDRKTVKAYLRELAARGFIQDTGRREGRTKQIVVWRLVGFHPDNEMAQRRIEARVKGTAGGTLSEQDDIESLRELQDIESQGEINTDSQVIHDSPQTVPHAGPLQEGTGPPTGPFDETERGPPRSGKGPAQEWKGAHRRATERFMNGVRTPDARAHARTGARARDPDPGGAPPPDPDRVRGFWASSAVNGLLSQVWLDLPEFARQPLGRLPPRLQELLRLSAGRITERFATAELERGVTRSSVTMETLQAEIEAEAAGIVSLWRTARAPAAAASTAQRHAAVS